MTDSPFSKAFARISEFVASQPIFVRSVYAETLLEDFFVSAVGALLAIRFYLMLTGYGQLRIGSLHIAHLVWGGLFMLASLVILLSTLNRRAKSTAAVAGGVGFGAFIDELGKFITSENNYFFEPAIAIIYIVFVVVFLIIRTISRRRALSPPQSTANIFSIAAQGSLAGLHAEEQQEALELLRQVPQGQLRDNLASIINGLRVERLPRFRPLDEMHGMIDRFYEGVHDRWWFSGIVVAFFGITAVTSLYALVGVVEWSLGLALWLGAGVLSLVALVWSSQRKLRYLNIAISAAIVIISMLISWGVLGNLKTMPLSIIDYAQFVFPGISGILIVIGMFILTRSRLRAYAIFRLAILVSIFFTQVFSFYEHQLLALVGLIGDILILIALRYMIEHEAEKAET